jgi:hypothetical protein
MATINPFFNRSAKQVEAEYVQDMIEESIKIQGLEVYYIPRILNNFDKIFGESTDVSFNVAIPMAMYPETRQFIGQDTLTRFGLQSFQTCDFSVGRRHFEEQYRDNIPPSRDPKLTWRPCEGDLIFISSNVIQGNPSIFEIKFVDDDSPVWHQLGKNFTWKLNCELFQYSKEEFSTGNTEIDNDVFGKYNTTNEKYILLEISSDAIQTSLAYEQSGTPINLEASENSETSTVVTTPYGDNMEIKQEFCEKIVTNEWDESDPFGGF